jgi:hypothetical protein
LLFTETQRFYYLGSVWAVLEQSYSKPQDLEVLNHFPRSQSARDLY